MKTAIVGFLAAILIIIGIVNVWASSREFECSTYDPDCNMLDEQLYAEQSVRRAVMGVGLLLTGVAILGMGLLMEQAGRQHAELEKLLTMYAKATVNLIRSRDGRQSPH